MTDLKDEVKTNEFLPTEFVLFQKQVENIYDWFTDYGKVRDEDSEIIEPLKIISKGCYDFQNALAKLAGFEFYQFYYEKYGYLSVKNDRDAYKKSKTY